MIVVACFSYSTYSIYGAFKSWETSPVETTVITKPIEEVTLPEILLCPPDGTNTALNLDLMRAEEMELSEAQREKLILVALKNLHNISINKFIEDQTMFHNPYSVFRVYAATVIFLH